MQLSALPPIHWLRVPQADSLNQVLGERFSALKDDSATGKTHFFHGRFENLYIGKAQLPEIAPLVELAESLAQQRLGVRQALRSGYWFNAMGPGHVTSRHSHEEIDELLSAVYYVQVPKDSGDLILHAEPAVVRITPEPGLMVLFPPDLEHEVTENLSDRQRLSIAFNFGPTEEG